MDCFANKIAKIWHTKILPKKVGKMFEKQ